MSTPAQLEAEDKARVVCYALIGRLFYQPPDAAVMSFVLEQAAGEGNTPYALAWQALQSACRESALEQVREEYDDLFVGVGKAAVTLYTAAYVAPTAPDRHLLALRNTLGELGLARRTDVGETEDHLSALCDVMRWLIQNGQDIERQRQFFDAFLSPAVEPMCAFVARLPRARFYRSVADYLGAYHLLERTAFDIG